MRRPALKFKLLSPSGALIDEVDYIKLRDAECKATLKHIEDDDGNALLCYRWAQAPVSQAHINMSEIMSGVAWDRCYAPGKKEWDGETYGAFL